jgi:DNA-binding transcriptional LysR family regulator
LKRLEAIFGDTHILQRYTSNAGILAAIKQGSGLGAMGCYFSDKEAALERIMPERFDYSFDAWLITHADLYKSARIKTVFNFLFEKLTEDADLFLGINRE